MMRHYFLYTIYVSILVVFFHGTTVQASSASLYITKSSQSISQGDTITLTVKVSSLDQSINAVSGTITFPSDLIQTSSISRNQSVLNIWTRDPSIVRNKIMFEGVILNPGYRGPGSTLFEITFEAKKSGLATVSFTEGALLANDGLGTNIIGALSSTSFNIVGAGVLDLTNRPLATSSGKPLALPVITDYSPSIFSKESAYLKGKGEPRATTKITFEDLSQKSFGEQFMDFVQSKKKRLSNVLVQNNDKGDFEYITPNNLVAGVYSATPFLVESDTNTEKAGLGVRLFVNDSKIIKGLIVFINILILLIPIVGLIMLIYFIPWYSSRRMRIMKRRMGLEEEKIVLTEHQLEHQDKLLYKDPVPNVTAEKSS